jgi:hypothetical protein
MQRRPGLRMISPRFFVAAIAATALAGCLIVGATGARAQGASCTILDDCSGIDTLPTASQCEVDSCTCAQEVECYLRGLSPTENWPVLPGARLELNKNFFHNRFVKTQISPQSLQTWKDARSPNQVADMPDGTVVYKSGYLPKPNNLARPAKPALSAYVLAKIEGYCPDGSSVGDYCLGGDWFGMEVSYADYGILTAGQIDNDGKSPRCFACHAAAETGDWLWQLYSKRRYP